MRDDVCEDFYMSDRHRVDDCRACRQLRTKDNAVCPTCHGQNTHKIYRPEVYEYNNICRDCDQGFN